LDFQAFFLASLTGSKKEAAADKFCGCGNKSLVCAEKYGGAIS
jgi:tRNA/tmRNA/rRNA uracil-C5-methylase (TrmA/RlmC/RlmD family)